MFKPAIVSTDSLAKIRNPAAPSATPDPVVADVFRAMHGFYGVLFVSKFSTGEADANGKDKGILSARIVWGHELAEFDRETVSLAIQDCKRQYLKFPPSLPEFLALCVANKPRYVEPIQPRIEISPELVKERAARNRQMVENYRLKHRAANPGMDTTPGLDLLKQAIADAVGCAGGDEAAALARLDRMLAPKQQAVPA